MDTNRILARAYAHWIEDGIVEIGLGGLFAVVGAYRALIHVVGSNSPYYGWLSLGLLVVMLGYAGGIGRAVKALKIRVAYPRTGYVNFKPQKRNYKRTIALFFFAGVLGTLIGILVTQPGERGIGSFIPIIMGACWAAFFVYVARRIDVQRFYYLAAFSVGVGILIGLLGVGIVFGISFYYLGIGLAQIVSGSVALVLYLQRHRPVDLNGANQ